MEYNMSDFVGVEIQGMKEFEAKLAKLPKEAQNVVIDEVSKYYLNVFQSSQPTPNFVPRAKAYPDAIIYRSDGSPYRWRNLDGSEGEIIRGYFSVKQFKKVMLLNAEGKVPYIRTQGLRKSWRQIDRGARSFIVNDSPGAPFVVGDETQSRHEKLVGWFRTNELMQSKVDKALKVADGAMKKAIRKVGLD